MTKTRPLLVIVMIILLGLWTSSFLSSQQSFGQISSTDLVRKVTVSFSQTEYELNRVAGITVQDTGANTDPGQIESVTVKLTSSTAQNEKPVTLAESGVNTGIFTSDVRLSKDNQICVEAPCLQTVITNVGEIVKATYQVEFTGADRLRECSQVVVEKCVKEYSTTALISAVGTISGRPYLLTLKNSDEGNTPATNVVYKATIQFGASANDYSVVDVERGNFDSAFVIGKNVVVFTAERLEPGEAMTGLVTFHFGKDVLEDQIKANIAVDVGANGKSGKASIDPGGVFEMVSEIVKIASDATDLAIKIYQNSVSCFSVDTANYDHTDNDFIAIYNVGVDNCSEHPEIVKMNGEMVSDTAQTPVTFHFFPDSRDVPAKSNRPVRLEVSVPRQLSIGDYYFRVDGTVKLNILGYEREVTSSGGETRFTVTDQGGRILVVPEFPISSIAVIGFVLAGAVLGLRLISNKGLKIG